MGSREGSAADSGEGSSLAPELPSCLGCLALISVSFLPTTFPVPLASGYITSTLLLAALGILGSALLTLQVFMHALVSVVPALSALTFLGLPNILFCDTICPIVTLAYPFTNLGTTFLLSGVRGFCLQAMYREGVTPNNCHSTIHASASDISNVGMSVTRHHLQTDNMSLDDHGLCEMTHQAALWLHHFACPYAIGLIIAFL